MLMSNNNAQLTSDNLNNFTSPSSNAAADISDAATHHQQQQHQANNYSKAHHVHAHLTLIGCPDGTGSDETNCSNSNWNGTCFDSEAVLNSRANFGANLAMPTTTTSSSPSSSAQFNCEQHQQQLSGCQVNGFHNSAASNAGSTSTITSSQATDQAFSDQQQQRMGGEAQYGAGGNVISVSSESTGKQRAKQSQQVSGLSDF